VTKATVYYHFPNKETIYAAVAADIAESYNRIVRRVTTDSERHPLHKLGELVCRFVHSVLDPRTKRIHYDQHIQLSDATKHILRASQHFYADAIGDLLREVQGIGLARPGDPKLMALAVFEGAGRMAIWYDPDGRVAPDAAHGTLCEMFLNGLLVERGIAALGDDIHAETARRAALEPA
jgi:AcrR family transcriptional regulator